MLMETPKLWRAMGDLAKLSMQVALAGNWLKPDRRISSVIRFSKEEPRAHDHAGKEECYHSTGGGFEYFSSMSLT
jgi:hypothetical protein